MLSLISMDEAKMHLRIDDLESDADIETKAVMATAIIVDYIKNPDHGWTVETVPQVIKVAVLLMLAQLFSDRENATITDPIKNLLHRQRDPSIA